MARAGISSVIAVLLLACDLHGSPSKATHSEEAETVDTATDVDADGDGSASHLDCDDSDPAIHPGATEVCNGHDDDCDDDIDDEDANLVADVVLVDSDGDGYGGTEKPGCQPAAVGGDCDDTDDSRYPGAAEVPCNDRDDDCDGAVAIGAAAEEGEAGYTTIQEAIDAIGGVGSVTVCPGTHAERLKSGPGTDLVLEGATGDPEDVVLTGENTWRPLHVWGGSSLTVRALTFEDGESEPTTVSDDEAGALYADDTDLVVEDCVFRNNHGKTAAGAIYFYGPHTISRPFSLTITGSLFEGNVADGNIGALQVGGFPPYRSVDIRDSVFRDNASYEGHSAMLIFTHGAADVLIEDTVIEDNYADYDSAGITLTTGPGAAADVVLRRVSLAGNIGQYGALKSGSTSTGTTTLTMDNCTVVQNVGAADEGGGATLVGPDICLTSVDSDWGIGTRDNVGGDLVYGYTWGETGKRWWRADEHATFTCCDDVCDLIEVPH